MKSAWRPRTRWRDRSSLLKTAAVGLLVVFNSACVGSPVEQQTEQKVSLVEAWSMKMTRKDADHVIIAYQPLQSSALNYPGANIQSDGRTLRVSLPKCAVTSTCTVMIPSAVKGQKGEEFWYEVVVPYRGEKVLVDGNGPVVDELPLTR